MELSRGLYTTNASSQEHCGRRSAALLLGNDGIVTGLVNLCVVKPSFTGMLCQKSR